MTHSHNLRIGFGNATRVGSVADIRPALFGTAKTVAGVIQASFKPQRGNYQVETFNRFGEKRVHRFLTKPDATAMVGNLRKRGYVASYKPL